jgi:lipid-A-disaccharide synthase
MPKKFFILACEPSADLHGSLLVEELKKMAPGAEFRGLGGPRMQASGVALVEDMTKISALGFTDVLRQYFRYREIFYRALREVQTFKPDAIIPIDSPAFNLRFAKKIQKRIPLFYYISPQIWAWGGRRIHTIKKTVSKMLAILPFEKEMYDKAGVPCEFVGHPLIDETHASADRAALRAKLGLREDEIAVGLLPGSRKREVERILPDLLKTADLLKKQMPAARFFLSRSSNVPASYYDSLLGRTSVKIEEEDLGFQDLVTAMDFAFVTSGTATLQTALLGTPFFLVYRASALTYEIGKRLVKVSYLGLVNLLAGKRVVPEFIQSGLHPETMAHEAKVLLENKDLYEHMQQEFEAIKVKLGTGGASRRAAEVIVNSL